MRGIYLVTDRALCGERGIAAVVAGALRGGICAVQLREKGLGTRDFLSAARELQALLAGTGVPLIINDRVDVALAVGADGVHLGQSDMPCRAARRLLGARAEIGLSVENLEQLAEAEDLEADYLGISPVFATPTKRDAGPAWGLAGLAEARRRSRHRLVAIGGINPGNAAAAARAGADAAAVVSAICAAADPCAAAAELRAAFEGAG